MSSGAGGTEAHGEAKTGCQGAGCAAPAACRDRACTLGEAADERCELQRAFTSIHRVERLSFYQFRHLRPTRYGRPSSSRARAADVRIAIGGPISAEVETKTDTKSQMSPQVMRTYNYQGTPTCARGFELYGHRVWGSPCCSPLGRSHEADSRVHPVPITSRTSIAVSAAASASSLRPR